MKKYILIILLLATIFSCTKTLDFDEANNETQLVLNSIIWPDSVIAISISKSTSILFDRQVGQITGGTLDLYEDGTLLTQITSPTGHFYASGIKPKAGKSYRIVVNSNGKQLEAETTIPDQAEVLSIDTTSLIDVNGVRRTQYKVKIKDPIGDDYYRIVVMNEQLTQLSSRDYTDGNNITRKYYYITSQYWINSEDPVFKSLYNSMGEDVIDMGPENDYNIFPDDYFKGKEYSVQFQMSPNGYGYYNPYSYGENSPFKKLFERNTIHIQKLSKDMYNYLKYLKLYNHYHDNPFSEPVPVYSNVKNGTGIFAGFNDNTVSHFEKVYIPFSMDTIQIEEGSMYNYH
ncbi:MAG: DUF4249 domain-containing protein [Bacteroidota bacterium]|nr:DUF4249 domain-containing protein [Bacteroidota bacterium]